MLYRSESFSGEWPTGVYWEPGIVREVPERIMRKAPPAPAGLALGVAAPEAPAAAQNAPEAVVAGEAT